MQIENTARNLNWNPSYYYSVILIKVVKNERVLFFFFLPDMEKRDCVGGKAHRKRVGML